MIRDIIKKSLDDGNLTTVEITALFEVPLFTDDSALILSASRRKSVKASRGLAEVHAQVGLNIAPCPKNCAFCSFAARNKIFHDVSELSIPEAVSRAQQAEKDGANAVYLMVTGDYPFDTFIETAKEVRKNLLPETTLVANIGDFTQGQAARLKDAGFAGIYHAVRLGEGTDTSIPVETRLQTFRHAAEAGLLLGTCLEPVGTEHTISELVQKTIITREANPVYSGAARRIPLPGTAMASHGMVSEARMAHILAVVRLALGYDIEGTCTHEPNVAGAAAGANLLWAETGSNPRDVEKETERRRGMAVTDCAAIFAEAEWRVLSGPSKFYGYRRPLK
jgi:biotin synthase